MGERNATRVRNLRESAPEQLELGEVATAAGATLVVADRRGHGASKRSKLTAELS